MDGVFACSHSEEADEEPDEGDEKNDAAMRRKTLGQSVEDRAAGTEEAPQPARLALDRLAVVGDQDAPRLRPLVLVEVGHIARLQRRNSVFTQLDPVADLGHPGIVRAGRPEVPALTRCACWSRGAALPRGEGRAPQVCAAPSLGPS